MKVYVAAASSEIERAKDAMAMLRSHGIEVTSRWVEAIEGAGEGNPAKATREERLGWAKDNIDDIKRSDVVWMLAPTANVMSHGAFFELGFARALRSPDLKPLQEGTHIMGMYDAPMIVVSGGDHRWVFLALADRLMETDVGGFDAVMAIGVEQEQARAKHSVLA